MEQEKISNLRKILKDAESKDPGIVKEEAKDFLKNVDAEELIQAEQAMIDEGVTPEAMSHLCAAHLELIKDDLNDIRNSLPEGHPVHTLILEHDEILKFLDELDQIRRQINAAKSYNEIPEKTFDLLNHIAHHLVAAEKHHQREENVLFPAAEEHGIYGPTQIMVEEHVRLRALKKKINEFAEQVNESNFDESKKDFSQTAGLLVKDLRDHIFKENNILYPATLKVIPADQWAKIKEDADKIGYCCFTPEYLKK